MPRNKMAESKMNPTVTSGSNSNVNWIKFENGTLIQYGNIGGYAESTSRYLDVYFPISFIGNNSYTVTANSGCWNQDSNLYESICIVRKIDNSHIQIYQKNTSQKFLNYAMWIAIGRWK